MNDWQQFDRTDKLTIGIKMLEIFRRNDEMPFIFKLVADLMKCAERQVIAQLLILLPEKGGILWEGFKGRGFLFERQWPDLKIDQRMFLKPKCNNDSRDNR